MTSDYDDEPQTAMLLTEQEWQDVAEMVEYFKVCTEWVDIHPRPSDETDDHVISLKRKRALADRITEAAT